jgi:hypothetical protein
MTPDLDAAFDPAVDRHVLGADQIAPEHDRLANPRDDAALFALHRGRLT